MQKEIEIQNLEIFQPVYITKKTKKTCLEEKSKGGVR